MPPVSRLPSDIQQAKDQILGGTKRSQKSVAPLLVSQLSSVLPKFIMIWQELQFCKGRRWRFDVAIPSFDLAIEIEGGLYVQGRHSRGAGMEKDLEKYAEAACLGWTVLRVSPGQVKSGQALKWIEKIIAIRH